MLVGLVVEALLFGLFTLGMSCEQISVPHPRARPRTHAAPPLLTKQTRRATSGRLRVSASVFAIFICSVAHHQN
jgi:hypothetical protein